MHTGGSTETYVDGLRLLALRWRAPVLALVTLAWVAGERATVIADWHYVAEGAHLLVSIPPWEVYRRAPDIQMGPLTLGLGGLLIGAFGKNAQLVWGAAAIISLPWLLHRLGRRLERMGRPPSTSTVLIGGLIVAPFWAQLVVTGHLDDWLVLVLLVEALPVSPRTPALLALAVAAKPSALIALPLLFAQPAKVKTLVLCGLASVAIWYPFLRSAPLEAGRVRFLIDPASALHLIGFVGVAPLWVRPVQLALAVIVGLLAGWRGGPSASLVAAAATRFAVDPGTWGYFLATVVFLALVHDLSRGGLRPSTACVAATTAFSMLSIPRFAAGGLRLATCAALVIVVMRVSARRLDPTQQRDSEIGVWQ